MDDQQILDLYWQRDDAAIAATAKSYGSYCRSIAWHILDNEQDVQKYGKGVLPPFTGTADEVCIDEYFGCFGGSHVAFLQTFGAYIRMLCCHIP